MMAPRKFTVDGKLTYNTLVHELQDISGRFNAISASILIFEENLNLSPNNSGPGLCCFCLHATHLFQERLLAKSHCKTLKTFLQKRENVVVPFGEGYHEDLRERFDNISWWTKHKDAVQIRDKALLPLTGVSSSAIAPFTIILRDVPRPVSCVRGVIAMEKANSEKFLLRDVRKPFSERVCQLIKFITEKIGLMHPSVLSELSRAPLHSTSYERRLERVNIAATKATAWTEKTNPKTGVPKGAYSHIRRYVPTEIPGYKGMLSMISNAGYGEKPAKLSSGLHRMIPTEDVWTQILDESDLSRDKGGEGKDGPRTEKCKKTDKSVSVIVFLRAYQQLTEINNNRDLECGSEILEAHIAKQARIEMVKGKYANIGKKYKTRGKTRSQMTLPILNGEARPLGIMNINSERYGWINRLWLPTAVELAKRAAAVITEERGYKFRQNENLKVEPKNLSSYKCRGDTWKVKQLRTKFRELYANDAVYNRIRIHNLHGYGSTSRTFRVEIFDRHKTDQVINHQVVRFFPNVEDAQKELNAYEFYVEPYLSTSYYCGKIAHAMDGPVAAISYAWAMLGSDEPINTFDSKITTQYERWYRPSLIKPSLLPVRKILFLLDATISQVFKIGLRPWHNSGKGVFEKQPPPHLLDLYERGRKTHDINEMLSTAHILDMQRPGLYELSEVENKAKEIGVHSTRLVDWYEENKEKIDTMVGIPTLGVCHGDLNLRNILVLPGKNTNFCLIDFDRVHRGHVYQDFARLETYMVDLFLNKLDSSPDKTTLWQNRLLSIIADIFSSQSPGKHESDEPLYGIVLKELGRKKVPIWFRFLISLVASIREEAYDFSKSREGSFARKQYAIEYYFALLCQYLDWISHRALSGESSRIAYKRDCEKLAQAAWYMAVEPLNEFLK